MSRNRWVRVNGRDRRTRALGLDQRCRRWPAGSLMRAGPSLNRDSDRAEVGELGPEDVARPRRRHPVQRPRQDDVAAAQPGAERAQLVRQPGHAAGGVAERGGSGAAVDRRRRCGRAASRSAGGPASGDRSERAAEHEPPARGVVRDGVDERDPPVRDPAVHDLDRRQHAGDRGQRVGPVTPGPARSRAMTKAISASTRGWSSVSSGISSPSSTNMSSSSTPKSGSSTPRSRCIGREVSPTLRPRTTAPAATRRSMLWVWIA